MPTPGSQNVPDDKGKFATRNGVFRLPKDFVPANTCSVDVLLKGFVKGSDFPAQTNMSFSFKGIEVEPGKRIQLTSQEEQDLRKAVRLLGYTKRVTEDDILKLKMEGKL